MDRLPEKRRSETAEQNVLRVSGVTTWLELFAGQFQAFEATHEEARQPPARFRGFELRGALEGADRARSGPPTERAPRRRRSVPPFRPLMSRTFRVREGVSWHGRGVTCTDMR
jgi:hypothetical protein